MKHHEMKSSGDMETLNGSRVDRLVNITMNCRLMQIPLSVSIKYQIWKNTPNGNEEKI